MSKKLRNITSATYISLQFVVTVKYALLRAVLESTEIKISEYVRHIATVYSHSNLANPHSAAVPSFVLLLFAFIPTDGAVIRTKQVLSVFGAVVHIHVRTDHLV